MAHLIPQPRLEVKQDREPATRGEPAETCDTITATLGDASVLVEILRRERSPLPPIVFAGAYVGEHRTTRYVAGELPDLRVDDLVRLEACLRAVMGELRLRGLVPPTVGGEG